ncbi:MAG: DNA polymerase II large subunit, partial [Candidatus Thermoplasmatota archaeon]
MENYSSQLLSATDNCYSIAKKARAMGYDPELYVEIPIAEDMAARVESLVGPKGIADRIRNLSKNHNRDEVSIAIAKEVVHRAYKSYEDGVYQAIRTALAILTEGVLVAPLEGVTGVKIDKNNDGSSYLAVQYAGPIRSAGGTAQAMSVLIADIVRKEIGIGRYIPTIEEIERYVEEMPLYREAQHLQYTPTKDEVEYIVKNCPICIDGEGTEEIEVSGYRDLPRVATNRVRGGAC